MTGIQNFSPRERGLIYVGGALFIAFLIWQFGVSPILSYKANADRQTVVAQRNFEIVNQGLPRLNMGPMLTGDGQNTPRQIFTAPALIRAAQAEDLLISRTQPENDGGMSFWFDNAETSNIYKFLETANQSYKVSISRVQITRGSPGKVDAQIRLNPTP